MPHNPISASIRPIAANKPSIAVAARTGHVAPFSRKLYAFALIEAHSRMLYLEFTHNQSFETFVRVTCMLIRQKYLGEPLGDLSTAANPWVL